MPSQPAAVRRAAWTGARFPAPVTHAAPGAAPQLGHATSYPVDDRARRGITTAPTAAGSSEHGRHATPRGGNGTTRSPALTGRSHTRHRPSRRAAIVASPSALRCAPCAHPAHPHAPGTPAASGTRPIPSPTAIARPQNGHSPARRAE